MRRNRFTFPCLASLLVAWSGLSYAAADEIPVCLQLVEDVNGTTHPGASHSSGFTALAGKIYFSATEPETGYELHVSDGTDAGTQRLLDLNPGYLSANAKPLAAVNNQLLFQASDGHFGTQLWSYSPVTRLTSRLTDFLGAESAPITLVDATSQRMLFADGAYKLWTTDASIDGTHPIPIGYAHTYVRGSAQRLGASVLFAVDDTAYVRHLLRWDEATDTATELETGRMSSGPNDISYSASCNGTYYLIGRGGGSDSGFFRSNGTTVGTVYLDKPVPSESTPTGGSAACLNGSAYFIGAVNSSELWLWKTDATASGTAKVMKLSSNYVDTFNLHTFANRLSIEVPGYIPQIVLSDGTASGAKSIALPAGWRFSYSPSPPFTIGNSEFVLIANDTDVALWKYSPSSTALELAVSSFHIDEATAAVVGNRIYADSGGSLLVSDGTSANTHVISTLWEQSGSAFTLSAYSRTEHAISQQNLYFTTDVGDYRRGLWRTHLGVSGAVQINPASYDNAKILDLVAVDGGLVFMTQPSGPYAAQFYAVGDDATQARLVMTTADGAFLQRLSTAAGDRALIGCNDSAHHEHLCLVTDATTGVVEDITPTNVVLPYKRPLGSVAGLSVFYAMLPDGSHSSLWRSDGTREGTIPIGGSFTNQLADGIATTLGNRIFFNAYAGPSSSVDVVDAVLGSVKEVKIGTVAESMVSTSSHALLAFQQQQVWTSDGTDTGTRLLMGTDSGASIGPLAIVGDRAHFFVRRDYGIPADHWVTDGTPAGTQTLQELSVFGPGYNIAALGEKHVLFECSNYPLGNELCIGDDLPFGDHLLADLAIGQAPSNVEFIVSTGDVTYFIAEDIRHGRELWMASKLPETIFREGFELR